jgi:Ca2+-binding EF-hand superfamily protein
MTLNAMNGIAMCSVTEDNGELSITILPTNYVNFTDSGSVQSYFNLRLKSAYGPGGVWAPLQLEEADVQEYLKLKGFSGTNSIKSIDFVESMDKLPSAAHKRVVLLDLLQIAFATADSDGDGKISMSEFQEFCTKYGISFDAAHYSDVFLEYDKDFTYQLSIQEFKALLLSTKLITLEDGTRNNKAAEFGVEKALEDIFWDHFFSKADSDGDGFIKLDEVASLIDDYGLGDRNAASKQFATYDKNDDGKIDRDEFIAMMSAEGVVTARDAKKESRKEEGGSGCAIL